MTETLSEISRNGRDELQQLLECWQQVRGHRHEPVAVALLLTHSLVTLPALLKRLEEEPSS